jgi:arginase
VSTLRAKCPSCRTLTAVAVGREYECHSCGAAYGAGLVRVPRAWGVGGEQMAAAASLPLPYPEALVVACDTLEEQTTAIATKLPARPLLLGGCCCTHTGAILGLAGRANRLAVVWFDAHGDLNTPETSPSGNAWGMPLRAAIDYAAIQPADIALVGTRSLDPPEAEFIAATGIDDDVERALAHADAVYVALDCDVFDQAEIASFMPEAGGPSVDEIISALRSIAAGGAPVAGLGLTGLTPAADVETLACLAAAAGL